MSRTAEDVRAWSLAGLSVVFAIVCALSLRDPQIVYFPDDSAMFRGVAIRGLAEGGFWFGIRPWGFPLLMKLCGLVNLRIVAVQFALHLASSVFFATALFVAARRTGLGLISAVAVLLFSCSPYLLGWTAVILTESLTHSLLLALLGSLLLLRHSLEGPIRRSTWALAAATAASGALLSATRDNWPYWSLFVAGFLIGPLLRVPARWTPSGKLRAGVAAVLIAVCALQLVSAKLGQRWREGMINVVFSRVVPLDEARERWQARYGLPVDEALIRIGEGFEPGYQRQANLHVPFRHWLVETPVVRSYAVDLLSHPIDTTRQVFRGHRITRDEFSWEYSNQQGDGTVVARAVRWGLFHPLLLPVGIDFLFPILALGWLARVGPRTWRGIAAVLFVFALYLPLLSALGYLSDSNEIYRHALPVAVGLRLLGLLATIGALGAVYERLRPGTDPPA